MQGQQEVLKKTCWNLTLGVTVWNRQDAQSKPYQYPCPEQAEDPLKSSITSSSAFTTEQIQETRAQKIRKFDFLSSYLRFSRPQNMG